MGESFIIVQEKLQFWETFPKIWWEIFQASIKYSLKYIGRNSTIVLENF